MKNVKIVNVVSTASLNQKLDFNELKKYPEIFHDSSVYNGRAAYLKTEKMNGKVILFLSGKIISVGTKNESQALDDLLAAKKFLVARSLINDIQLQSKIQNMVVVVDFGKQIDVESLTRIGVIYEPDQFSGAILRLHNPFRAGVLFFSSGKIVISGLKNTTHIEPVIREIFKMIIKRDTENST